MCVCSCLSGGTARRGHSRGASQEFLNRTCRQCPTECSCSFNADDGVMSEGKGAAVGGGGQRGAYWGQKETLLGVMGVPCREQMMFH